MKKKCMAVGGTAKKPATMEEQLAALRGKVRPGYQAGGPIYRSGNSFTDQQIGDPMKGIASAGMSGQVDSMLDRAKAMPNSIASAPQPYAGSVIPGQPAAQPSNAPVSTPQSMGYLGAADYSTGPKHGGFVYEDGTPRPTESNQSMQSTAPAPLLSMAEKEAAIGLNPNRIYKPGSTMDPLASGGGIAQALKTANDTGVFERPAMDQNQLAKFDVPRRQSRRRPEFAEGRMPKKQAYFGDRPPPQSAMNDDSPPRPIPPRVMPSMPARPVSAPAQPVKVTLPAPEYPQERMRPAAPQNADAAPGTYPGVTGIVDAIRNRKVANAKAMDYKDGGMVRFAGKGGPRDDQIPVKVAGQEINVSNGENAVILPAKTAANPAALYAIDGIIQATNDGRKPKMGMEKGGKYASGSMPNDEWLPEGGYLRTPEGRQRVAEAIVNAPAFGGNVSFGGQQPATAQSIYAPATDALKKGLSGEGMRPEIGIIGPRAVQASPAEQAQSSVAARNAEIMNSGAGAGRINLPITQAQKQAAIANTAAARQAQGITAGVDQPSGAVVKDGMTTTQMGAGFDPTKLQIAPGYGMASDAAGKTIAAGNAEYVGADGRPTSRWTDTQQYKDAIARNEADKLRLAEMQAQRLGADPMSVQAASQGIASGVLNARTQEAGLQRNAQIQSLVAKAAAEPDQGKRQQFIDAALAMQGKDNKQEKNLQVVDLGSESVPDGMGGVKAIPRGQALYDARMKQWIPLSSGAQQQAQQAQQKAPQSAIDHLKANPALADQFKQKYGYLP